MQERVERIIQLNSQKCNWWRKSCHSSSKHTGEHLVSFTAYPKLIAKLLQIHYKRYSRNMRHNSIRNGDWQGRRPIHHPPVNLRWSSMSKIESPKSAIAVSNLFQSSFSCKYGAYQYKSKFSSATKSQNYLRNARKCRRSLPVFKLLYNRCTTMDTWYDSSLMRQRNCFVCEMKGKHLNLLW